MPLQKDDHEDCCHKLYRHLSPEKFKEVDQTQTENQSTKEKGEWYKYQYPLILQFLIGMFDKSAISLLEDFFVLLIGILDIHYHPKYGQKDKDDQYEYGRPVVESYNEEVATPVCTFYIQQREEYEVQEALHYEAN